MTFASMSGVLFCFATRTVIDSYMNNMAETILEDYELVDDEDEDEDEYEDEDEDDARPPHHQEDHEDAQKVEREAGGLGARRVARRVGMVAGRRRPWCGAPGARRASAACR